MIFGVVGIYNKMEILVYLNMFFVSSDKHFLINHICDKNMVMIIIFHLNPLIDKQKLPSGCAE